MNNDSIFFRLGFLLLAVVLVSCNSSTVVPGFVSFMLNSNPTTLDPAYVVDVPGGTLAAKLFNGLVRIDDDLRIVPDLATRWTISRDGKTYRFYLRENASFSNGRKVTARDFVYSFRRVLDPANHCPNVWVLEKIKGADAFRKGKSRTIEGLKAISDSILEITLERPFSPFLSLLTMTAAYAVPREEVEKYGDSFGFHPVGTGPYVLESWTQNTALVFRARKDYFEPMPGIKGLIYRIIPEDLTAMTEFEIGNLDVVTLPASAYRRYSRDPVWKDQIDIRKGLNTYYLGFNCQKVPFSDPDVRRAASYAVDVRKIYRTLLERRGRLAEGPVPDTLRSWKIINPYSYDPGRAKKLLQESGIPIPVNVDFYITADQNIIDMAEVMQSYLDAAGFSVHIKQLEWSSYKEAINRGEADMFYLSWWADYPDAENFLYPLFDSANMGPAGNRTRYGNPEVDRLIEQGQSAVSKRERDEAYGEAEQIIVRDAPWLSLWHANDYLIRGKRIEKYSLPPVYSSDKGLDIVLKK